MKNRIRNLMITATLICSACSTVSYLPDTSGLSKNVFGSYIVLHVRGHVNVDGELIAVNPQALYVLRTNRSVMRLDSVSRFEIEDFSLRYAKGKEGNYAWTIPLSAAVTISHGWYLIFSLPINLVTTLGITSSAGGSFKLNKNDISWDELSKFARFPQGIPAHIHVEDIQ